MIPAAPVLEWFDGLTTVFAGERFLAGDERHHQRELDEEGAAAGGVIMTKNGPSLNTL
ncbi:MAG: hypothetical protein Greene041619_523 [Candidatus Peregrinibacteria bacterium Greene0416_19]|nr:MAG: hypothetical protein Greene041619_523 [Candidatus Peregrinibacteria bacterium Greene0416_19]